jgi:hypothetical protein
MMRAKLIELIAPWQRLFFSKVRALLQLLYQSQSPTPTTISKSEPYSNYYYILSITISKSL